MRTTSTVLPPQGTSKNRQSILEIKLPTLAIQPLISLYGVKYVEPCLHDPLSRVAFFCSNGTFFVLTGQCFR